MFTFTCVGGSTQLRCAAQSVTPGNASVAFHGAREARRARLGLQRCHRRRFLAGALEALGDFVARTKVRFCGAILDCPPRHWCSTNIIIATEVIGFVREAIRKIASVFIPNCLSRSWNPNALRYATLPLRATRTTAPGIRPLSSSDGNATSIRFKRSGTTDFTSFGSRKGGKMEEETEATGSMRLMTQNAATPVRR